jgi:hypothetical protein
MGLTISFGLMDYYMGAPILFMYLEWDGCNALRRHISLPTENGIFDWEYALISRATFAQTVRVFEYPN